MISRQKLTTTRRRFLTLSAAALSGFSLSNCGWRLAKVNSNSRQTVSNELYIFTSGSYTDESLLKRFTDETGIKITADVFESNEEMLARYQAGGGQNYSVLYPSDYMVTKMVELGLLMELDHALLPGIDDVMERFQNPPYDPNNRHSAPLSWGTTGLIYNSKKLKEAPKNWDFLWKNQKELKGKISLLNDPREVFGAVLRMEGFSLNSNKEEEVQKAYEKLKELKPTIASFTNDAWRTQILAGDLTLAMCYSSDASEIAKEHEDFPYVLPQSGTSFWTDTMVIPKTAPNPEGAYKWLNFMMQPEVAAQVSERISFATASQSAFKLLPAKVRENKTLFPPEEMLKKCESIAPLGEFGEVYEKYWTKLTSA